MTGVSEERALWLARYVLPHEAELRAWLSRRSPSTLEVDDIIQETYARLVAAESVAGVRNPRTYAFSAANSVILSHLRRSKVVSIKAAADMDSLGVASSEPSPERVLLDQQELRRLAAAMAELPPKTREVFTLRRVQGLSQREIGLQLGMPESTVEKHVARAIHFLMNRLGRGGNLKRRASKLHEDQSAYHTDNRARD